MLVFFLNRLYSVRALLLRKNVISRANDSRRSFGVIAQMGLDFCQYFLDNGGWPRAGLLFAELHPLLTR